MNYYFEGIAYPVVIIRDGALRVPAIYAGRFGHFEVWIGTDKVAYFM